MNIETSKELEEKEDSFSVNIADLVNKLSNLGKTNEEEYYEKHKLSFVSDTIKDRKFI